MSRLMRLSRDVSGTLDPARVAELLARHLQETMRADLCVISVYRAEEGEVRTFASWPPEYAASYDRSYTLDEFPLTRRVVEGQELDIDARRRPGRRCRRGRRAASRKARPRC